MEQEPATTTQTKVVYRPVNLGGYRLSTILLMVFLVLFGVNGLWPHGWMPWVIYVDAIVDGIAFLLKS